jgi:hypothetical protein
MSRKLSELNKELLDKYHLFKQKMDDAGLDFIITRTGSSNDEQKALYAQGRKTFLEIMELRTKAGMYPIGVEEASLVVTWTLKSKHIIDKKHPKSRAFDIALVKEQKPHWNSKISINNNDIPDYTEIGLIVESVGLKWGGRFKRPDYCHIELIGEIK